MPELPEVQTVVNTLRPRVLGRTITFVRVWRQDIISPAHVDLKLQLPGRIVADIFRRGKKIIFRLDDGNRFYIHLGMSGRLSLQTPDSPLARHTHLAVDVGDEQMRLVDPRRFGGVWWLGTQKSADADLGPEPLTMNSAELARRLSRTHRAVKSALLDQKLIAGLGNIYADESLFEARIHPRTFADKLSAQQIRRLNRAIKLTLRRALRSRGSTLRDYRDAEGNPGAFQKLHRVYDRAGQECRVCGRKIIRIVIGGRSAHYCPGCQSGTIGRRERTALAGVAGFASTGRGAAADQPPKPQPGIPRRHPHLRTHPVQRLRPQQHLPGR